MLPYRWRKVSPLTAEASCAAEIAILRNGIDRKYAKQDNGVWVAAGGAAGRKPPQTPPEGGVVV